MKKIKPEKEIAVVETPEVTTTDQLEAIEQFIIDAGSDNLQTFGGKFEGGIHIQQIPDELAPCLLEIINSGEPIRAYLEIGAAAGGTAFVIHHVFNPEYITLIDDNKHHKASLRAGILAGVPHEEIIGNSHALHGVDRVRGEFDLMLLDADLSFNGMMEDIYNYGGKLRKGGFLILHDTVLKTAGVREVVAALKQTNIFEFINEYVSAKHVPACGVALFRKAI